MNIPIALLALSIGAFPAHDGHSHPSMDYAQAIRTVLASPPPDFRTETEAMSLDLKRFRFDPTQRGFAWSLGDAWSPDVLGALVQARPDQRFCEESIETFDRCLAEDGAPHAIIGDIGEMPEGQVSVRVMFVRRYSPHVEGGSRLEFAVWEYLLDVDTRGEFRISGRTREAGGHGRDAPPDRSGQTAQGAADDGDRPGGS
jgi:hypothetical protein